MRSARTFHHGSRWRLRRGGSEPGRYQSPQLEGPELESFLKRFGAFLGEDSRHDLWLHSMPDDVTLVWDRHDLVFAYGALGVLTDVLESGGLREGWPEVPVPHAHHYHPVWDHAESRAAAGTGLGSIPARTRG